MTAAAARRLAAALLLTVACAAIAMRAPVGLDYRKDAMPAIQALVDGGLAGMERQPMMGGFSILLRAPFAALGGEDVLLSYRLGALACLLSAALLAAALWPAMARRGSGLDARLAVAGLVVAGPMSFNAMQTGHPEEVLGAALCVGAVMAALRGRALPAMLLLGLAIATKQWAVIAVLPVLVALPRGRRLAPGLAGAGLAAALWLPLALSDLHGFIETNLQGAASPGSHVYAFSAWWPLADGPTGLPSWAGTLAHPLIVLLPLPLTGLYLRRREATGAEGALLVLAVAFLFRAVLDPVNNGYYHLPFLLSLVAYEALVHRGLPVLSMASAGWLWFLITFVWPLGAWGVFNALYLAWAAATMALLGCWLWSGRRPDRVVLHPGQDRLGVGDHRAVVQL